MAHQIFPWIYQAYGLRLKSDIQIPIFLADRCEQGPCISAHDEHDWVTIHLDRSLSIAQEIPHAVAQESIAVGVKEEGIMLYLKDIALFSIQQGNSIRYHPVSKVKADSLSLALSGVVMAALLFQRGCFIAHGSAVSIAGESILFLGDSGAGKSSLAIALHQRGYPILTDDLAGITMREGKPSLVPAFPQMRVTQDSAIALGLPWADLIQLSNIPKRGFRFETEFISQAVPLRQIYILQPSQGDTPCYQSLQSYQKIMELMHHSEVMSLFEHDKPQHFRACSALAQTIPIDYFQRPMHWATLQATLDDFERQVSSTSQAS